MTTPRARKSPSPRSTPAAVTAGTLAYLKVLSTQLSAEAITLLLALPCDRGWRRGDALSNRRRPKVRRAEHGWVLHSEPAATTVADNVHSLGHRLGADTAAALGTLVRTGRARAEVVAYSSRPEAPAAGTGTAVVHAIDELAALLGVAFTSARSQASKTATVTVWSTASPSAAAIAS